MMVTPALSTRSPGTDDGRRALVEVERLFHEQLSPLRLHPGAALAVYWQGRLVLDLVGGYADTQRGEPVRTGHTLPPLLRDQAARLGRPLAADRARRRGARRPGRRALAGVRPAAARSA